ncbi:acyltransferase family protein [Stenotrophobium rhamnosiphilum]|nr:acyltransferase family protein [Stenotrophobium rhamnosiphilum]
MRYRADVDGLRAVAILPVVLFHAGIDAFSGGYVGVDVFFVISGYLITSILLNDLHSGRFSIASFYERRIRRIFPALFGVLLFTIVVASVIFTPAYFKEFGQSVIATTLFSSNILFWTQAGYFDGPAEMKPLLHTWSLAVEEQFYIFLPLLLWGIYKWGKSRWALYILPLLLVSLLLNIFSVQHYPTAAFFLAPTRVWELLLGSMIALSIVPPITGQALREVASLLGFGMIAWCTVALTDQTPFPGAYALLPCIGAGLIIHAGAETQPAINRLLASRPLVLIGLISYSLYLWHWPLIVFAKYLNIDPLPTWGAIVLIGLSALIATISWRFIEAPFRKKQPGMKRRALFISALSCMGCALIVGLSAYLSDGWRGRFSDEVNALNFPYADLRVNAHGCNKGVSVKKIEAGHACLLGNLNAEKTTVALVGDSHAAMLYEVFDEALRSRGLKGVFFSANRCVPLYGVVSYIKSDCTEIVKAYYDQIAASSDQVLVLMASEWSEYATGYRLGERTRYYLDDLSRETSVAENERTFRRGLQRTIEKLPGKKLVIIEPVPEQLFSNPDLPRYVFLGREPPRLSPEMYLERNAVVRDIFSNALVSSAQSLTLLDPSKYLCDLQQCYAMHSGMPLYFDDNHLTRLGANLLRPLIDQALNKVSINR